jgi:hypothetical protein
MNLKAVYKTIMGDLYMRRRNRAVSGWYHEIGLETPKNISLKKQYAEWCETLNRCRHEWANKAGAGYRENPVEVCIKCGLEL